MVSFMHRFLPLKWYAWTGPVLLVVCLYFMVRLGFSESPLFVKSENLFGQGEVPIVHYRPSFRLWGLIAVFAVFLVLFFHSIRQWARYYLNRKLILSYLFFSIVPMVTIILIGLAGVRAWFGISNTLNIERILGLYGAELETFTQTIQTGFKNQDDPVFRERLDAVIRATKESEIISGLHILTENVRVEAYWLSEKKAGEPRSLVPFYFQESSEARTESVYYEDSETYERLLPAWLRHDQWTDIINKDGNLFLQHFNASEYEENQIIMMASIPIAKTFLNQIREFQPVRITLANKEGTRYIKTDSMPGKWYLKLLLKTLSGKWDVQALNWYSGYYEEYGRMTFELEPAAISATINQASKLHLFHDEQKKFSFRFIFWIAFLLVIAQFVAVFFGFYLIRYITRSLNVIAYGYEKIKAGRLNYRLPYIGKDQLGSMGRSFNGMVSSIESLMNQVMEKEKYQEELRIARDIQMSLLPNMNAMDSCDNIAASCIPAQEVGGDYYEILKTATGDTGIFIADVSGKGTSAAFYMAELKGVLLALKHLWDQPRELMMSMNEILQPALSSNVFISAAYLLLQPEQGAGKMVRAGHCPAFHLKKDGTVKDLMPPGIAIGIVKAPVFAKIMEVAEFPMNPQDKVILYTDGLDEMTFHQEMYGTQRLKELLRQNSSLSVSELRDQILEDVLNFLSSESQNDDLTLVIAGLPNTNRND